MQYDKVQIKYAKAKLQAKLQAVRTAENIVDSNKTPSPSVGFNKSASTESNPARTEQVLTEAQKIYEWITKDVFNK